VFLTALQLNVNTPLMHACIIVLFAVVFEISEKKVINFTRSATSLLMMTFFVIE